MATNGKPISTIIAQDPPTNSRIRRVDWEKVLIILDGTPGVWHLIGEFDQSVRTHINQGRYSHIDPSLYVAKTGKTGDRKRTRANLYMQRIAE